MPDESVHRIGDQLATIYGEVARIHEAVDRQRDLLRRLLGAQSDPALRAEDAGTAIHRLRWALERLEHPAQRFEGAR